MGRQIRSIRVGTQENFKRILNSVKLYQIDGNAYWSEDGGLYMVASQEWTDYLTSRSDEIPIQSPNVDADFNFDKDNLMELMFGGGIDG